MGQLSSAEHRDLSALAPELSQSLLEWWEIHGRKDPSVKPWMFTKDGRWPEPDEELDVWKCWVAEMILIPRSTPLSVWQLVVCVWPWSVMTQRV